MNLIREVELKRICIEKGFDYKNHYAELSYFLDSDVQILLDLLIGMNM